MSLPCDDTMLSSIANEFLTLPSEFRSLFDNSGCLVPWFHGTTPRDDAVSAIKEWEASRGDGREQHGVFLFRYSNRQVCRFSYSLIVCAEFRTICQNYILSRILRGQNT